MPDSEQDKTNITTTAPPTQTSKTENDTEDASSLRFSPEEEATLLQESTTTKAEANALFTSGDYHNALARYQDALASCPRYLDYPLAVLHSNVAACHLKLDEYEPAIKAATASLDALARLDPPPKGDAAKDDTGKKGEAQPKEEHKPDDADEEIISSGATRAAPQPLVSSSSSSASPAAFQPSDILRIRTKALLRRARARSLAGGWSNLAGAEEDYRTLSGPPLSSFLTPADAAVVRRQLRDLPPRTKAAQEAEVAQMWGKLRQLGDGILKPFGLSTDNFQMVKDEKTGGYSMNFSQGGGGPSKE